DGRSFYPRVSEGGSKTVPNLSGGCSRWEFGRSWMFSSLTLPGAYDILTLAFGLFLRSVGKATSRLLGPVFPHSNHSYRSISDLWRIHEESSGDLGRFGLLGLRFDPKFDRLFQERRYQDQGLLLGIP